MDGWMVGQRNSKNGMDFNNKYFIRLLFVVRLCVLIVWKQKFRLQLYFLLTFLMALPFPLLILMFGAI